MYVDIAKLRLDIELGLLGKSVDIKEEQYLIGKVEHPIGNCAYELQFRVDSVDNTIVIQRRENLEDLLFVHHPHISWKSYTSRHIVLDAWIPYSPEFNYEESVVKLLSRYVPSITKETVKDIYIVRLNRGRLNA